MDSNAWAAVSAVAASLTLIVYFALLWFAIKQVGEAKRLRRAQVRPFVVVDIEPGFLLYLTIENFGTTLARNVKFAFNPPLASSLTGPTEIENAPLLRDGVATFPPRKRYRILLDTFPDAASELPMEYDVTVTYEDDNDENTYQDHYTLDLKAFLYTELGEKGLPDLVSELERVRKELEKWTDSGLRGLLVHTRSAERTEQNWTARLRRRTKGA